MQLIPSVQPPPLVLTIRDDELGDYAPNAAFVGLLNPHGRKPRSLLSVRAHLRFHPFGSWPYRAHGPLRTPRRGHPKRPRNTASPATTPPASPGAWFRPPWSTAPRQGCPRAGIAATGREGTCRTESRSALW